MKTNKLIMAKAKEVAPVIEKPKGITLTDEQTTEYNTLVSAHGTVHIIATGNGLVSFLSEPSYETYKTIAMMVMKDQSKSIEAGEMLLFECYVGGHDFTTSSNKVRFMAAMLAFTELVNDVEETVEVVKKN
jgi:hypothetical protein